MAYVFLALALGLGILVLAYRREIQHINQQLEDIKARPTNRLVQQNLYPKELNDLVQGINQAMAKERDLRIQLQRKEDLQQELLTNLSHDIRTPLTSLDGYIQLLAESENEEDRDRYLTIIQNRLARLSTILDQMFLYMKLEDADLTFDLVEMDVKEALLRQIFDYYESFAQDGKEPSLDLPDQAVSVRAHPDLLEQVLSNVLKNTLVHGDGNLSIRLTEGGRIEIANPFEGGYAGDPNDLFNRFQRSDKHRSTESSGLGLSIARSALEKMDGTIEARIEDQTFIIDIQFKRPGS